MVSIRRRHDEPIKRLGRQRLSRRQPPSQHQPQPFEEILIEQSQFEPELIALQKRRPRNIKTKCLFPPLITLLSLFSQNHTSGASLHIYLIPEFPDHASPAALSVSRPHNFPPSHSNRFPPPAFPGCTSPFSKKANAVPKNSVAGPKTANHRSNSASASKKPMTRWWPSWENETT
jgi:hypothetical protein